MYTEMKGIHEENPGQDSTTMLLNIVYPMTLATVDL